jgi:hypothetical protein
VTLQRIRIEDGISAAQNKETSNDWVLVTLGRLDPSRVRAALKSNSLLERIAPIFLLSSSENWLAIDTVDIDLKFLIKQNL